MHAFILAGGTPLSRTKFIEDLKSHSTELIHVYAEKSSITIKQIGDLSGPLSISPRLPRIVWIEEANLMTIPAQNALLKMLEEPPASTDFYLTCTTVSSLLPTIRSRAKTIAQGQISSATDPSVLSDLKVIMAMTAGDRLAAITKRDRSETILWISQIELSLKEKLRSPSLSPQGATTLARIAKSVQNAHSQLLSNCSVGLVTQHFYLTLPHTRSTK